jgi:hypothetical protein
MSGPVAAGMPRGFPSDNGTVHRTEQETLVKLATIVLELQSRAIPSRTTSRCGIINAERLNGSKERPSNAPHHSDQSS